MCMRCTKADGLLAAPPAQPPAGDAGETLVMWLAEKCGTSIFDIPSPAQVAEEGDKRIADQLAARRADREEIGRLRREVEQVTNQREFWKAASERYKTEAGANAQAARELARIRELLRKVDLTIGHKDADKWQREWGAELAKLLYRPEGTP